MIMSYKIKPTEVADIFTLEDEVGHLVADVRGQNLAKLFAAMPELLQALDAMLDVDLPFPYGRAKELQDSLKPYRQ